MARQKGSHRFLILLRGKGAGGVNQPPAGTHQLRAGIQNFRLPPGKAVSFGQSLYWAPEEMPDIARLKVLRPGLELGAPKKDRFEPAHALALWLKGCAVVQDFDPDSPQIAAFLHGDVVPSPKKGWCLVTSGGYSIGWGKGDGTVLKNHYPKGLRR